MKLSEFLEVAGKSKLADRSKDAARMVLVEGVRAVDAARRLDMTRQHVQESVQRIEAAYMRAHGVPDGWECVTVCVPMERAGNVREIELQARRDAGLSMDYEQKQKLAGAAGPGKRKSAGAEASIPVRSQKPARPCAAEQEQGGQ